jgi:uncharacterized BrkB/YihY/UPF0761 family membrane protein
VLPGAAVATAMWFLTTLVFGLYVTKLANYSEVYGSLGAGIALLFWLYLISLSVLCGAEFNAQLRRRGPTHRGEDAMNGARQIWLGDGFGGEVGAGTAEPPAREAKHG